MGPAPRLLIRIIGNHGKYIQTLGNRNSITVEITVLLKQKGELCINFCISCVVWTASHQLECWEKLCRKGGWMEQRAAGPRWEQQRSVPWDFLEMQLLFPWTIKSKHWGWHLQPVSQQALQVVLIQVEIWVPLIYAARTGIGMNGWCTLPLPRGAHPLPYWSEGSCGQTFLGFKCRGSGGESMSSGRGGWL